MGEMGCIVEQNCIKEVKCGGVIEQIGIKERRKCGMLTDEAAFGAMCRMLGLSEITDIMSVPDATIREKCGDGAEGHELANLLINLKRETQRQAIAALTGSGAGASGGGGGGGDGGPVDMGDAYGRMGGGPNHGAYGGMTPRALLRTMEGLR
jgi:hypothetical protein